jgi:predicted Zn-dependent peptidase
MLTIKRYSIKSESKSHLESYWIVLFVIGSCSRYETDANQGVSHMLEHMAFKSTANRTHQQVTHERMLSE